MIRDLSLVAARLIEATADQIAKAATLVRVTAARYRWQHSVRERARQQQEDEVGPDQGLDQGP